MSEREPIGVIGTGYVGLVTAAGFAELGNEVWCIDIDAEKIRGLQDGRIPIWEPGLEDLVAKHRGRLHFSTDIADALEHARLLFVAVGTPPTYSGDADLSAVFSVVDAMPPSDRHALVMKSTVPCGTGNHIKRRFAETGKSGFRYVSCPEFLKEGSAVADFLAPDRVVVGDDGDWAGDAVVDLYAPLDAPLVRTDIRSAEMIKLASNAFLATSPSSSGSQIGMRPCLRASIFSASMSMHQTSLPSSAKPAAVTKPTYPVPMTAIGSLILHDPKRAARL
ncbi:MAG: UDPglucose 6-dehydrogenase, partial [Solirubrobacteraceae bacterium]|nr:UDPglucose 6-dehydrogenase [Solirubrobacteraceae bacterium]